MKKIILASMMTAITTGVFAQNAVDAQVRDAQCKTVVETIEKAEKATLDEKKSLKSATWVKLAEAYEEMALACGKDSLASEKAYNTYKKALAVDAGGKGSKDIVAAMKSQKLYSALMQQGATAYNAKSSKNAATLFKLASETTPKDTTAALYAGIVSQQEKNLTEAKTYFARFIEQGGKDPAVYYSLADIYKNDKDNVKAVEILKKGIQINPKDKDLQNSLINTYITSGMMNDAISSMKQMIAATPNTPENAKTLAENIKNLGTLYENGAEEYSRKIRPLESASNSTGRDKASIEKDLTNAQQKKSAYEEELVRLNDRLKKEPKNAGIKSNIASVTQMLANSKNEIESLTDKLEKANAATKNAGNASELPELKAKEAELKGLAVENYKKSLSIDPNNFDANYNLGVFYFNSAVSKKGEVDKMDMKTYNEKGKAIERDVCSTFSEAKVFFDKAKSIKADQDVDANLQSLKGILEQCSKSK